MPLRHLFIFLVCLFLATACSNSTNLTVPLAVVASETDNGAESLDNQEAFKFAIASIVSIRETHRTYYKFINNLEKELGRPVEIIQKQTYTDIKKAFERGEIDAGIVCTYLAVIGSEEGIFEKIAMPVINNQKLFTSYIIVRKDTEYNSIADLKSLSFAFSDPLSYSGYFVPRYEISKGGYELGNYFSNYYYTYSHDNTILAVANGLVDGGATHSEVYKQLEAENNPIIEKLKIIGVGPYVGNFPIVVRPNLEQEIKETLVNVVLSMHLTEEGQKALGKLNIDYFIEPEEELYSPVLEMLAELGEIR